MKKFLIAIVAIALCVCCVVACVACNNGTDYEKIQKKGKFIVGITDAEPMNYYENNELVGFDTEFTKAVAAKLGLEAEFVEISWGNKYIELSTGSIDCIWNGFTANCSDSDGVQRSDKVALSNFYMFNEQCVVTKAADVSKFTSVADLAGKKAGAEGGSAGESFAKDAGATVEVTKTSQLDVILDIKSGSVDFIVIDRTLADRVIGKGDNADLAIVSAIRPEGEPEKYAIGFRKGSDFADKVNEAMVALVKDGTLLQIAAKYGLENLLITDYAE